MQHIVQGKWKVKWNGGLEANDWAERNFLEGDSMSIVREKRSMSKSCLVYDKIWEKI